VEIARLAEQLRRELREGWLPASTADHWIPTCQIVVHANRKSYLAAVGPGGERTVGSSLVGQLNGRITGRRIDLVAGAAEGPLAALAHELTHVVLNDRFTAGNLPRWVDEGIAILADSPDKRRRHRIDLERSLEQRQLSLPELLLNDAPMPERAAAFYAQSASLAEYLIHRRTPEEFLVFVESVGERGYDGALREHYGISNVGQLEWQWRQHVKSTAARERSVARRAGEGRLTTPLTPEARPVGLVRRTVERRP
jgi:hypothetical protein